MSVREYIGARYVPIFADPSQWDNTNTYEPLTIVTNNGNSYTSRQYVPAGIDISNTDFWVLTGNYNAQIEAYRAEVEQFNGRITENESDITELEGVVAPYTSENPIASDITELQETVSPYTSNNPIKTAIDKALLKDEVDYLGLVGDSFTHGTYGNWVDIVVSKMGFKGTINKSQGSTGFLAGTKTFEQQFDELLANANFNRVTHIVIYGGLNDYTQGHDDPDELTSTFNSIYNKWKALPTPRPKMYMCFGNARSAANGYGRGYISFVNKCNRRLRDIGFKCAEWVYSWLLCEKNSVNYGDDIHPSDYGFKIIAGYMMQVLQDSYCGVSKCFRFDISTDDGDPATGFVQYFLNNDTVGFIGKINTPVTGFDSSHPTVKLYTPEYMQLSVSTPGNLGNAQDVIPCADIIQPRIDTTNGRFAYYNAALYRVDNSIVMRLRGSDSNANNYATAGAYAANNAIFCGQAQIA